MVTRLHIDDWFVLEMAFTYAGGDRVAYLDLRTGGVRVFTANERLDDRALREFKDEPGRFVHIEPVRTVDQYRWLVNFAASVEDSELRGRLERVLEEPRTFRNFMDVLHSSTAEWNRWRCMRAAILQEHIIAWLAERDVVVDSPPRSSVGALVDRSSTDEAEALRRVARGYIDRLSPVRVELAVAFLRHLHPRNK